MVNRFQKVAERLKGKGQAEIKQTPLRMPKDLYEEYQQVCKDLGSNVNEFTVELIRLSLEEYKADKEKKKKKPSKAAQRNNDAMIDSDGKGLAGTDKVINSLTGNSKEKSK